MEGENYKGYIITGPNNNSIYLPVHYSAFMNCRCQMIVTISSGYISGTPELENPYGFEDPSFYGLSISNQKNGEDITIGISSFFKKCYYPIRAVSD